VFFAAVMSHTSEHYAVPIQIAYRLGSRLSLITLERKGLSGRGDVTRLV
jgi:hypothetical protein